MEAHRSGLFKQQNKKHKSGQHRSKGEIDAQSKGRRSSVKQLTQRTKRDLSRTERRHQSNQIRKHKRQLILAEKRSLGLGGASSPPFLTAIISLCEDVCPAAGVLRLLVECDQEATVTSSNRDVTYISVPRYKSRFGFVIPSSDRLYDVLDALKVCDTLLLIWPTNGELNSESELLLSCIFSQGLPATINLVMGMNNFSNKQKEQSRKSVAKLLDKWSFKEKAVCTDNSSDGLVILRHINGGKKRPLTLQKKRAHILVESFEKSDIESDVCTLKVNGYIRGPSLSVNSLVHIPGLGDFQMKQIDILPDPHLLTSATQRRKEPMDEDIRVLELANPATQESLQSEVVPDPMEGEQTWPTPEELDQVEKKEKVKRVPKGTSEYQAAWIPEDGETGDEDETEESDEESVDDAEMVEQAIDDDQSTADDGEHDINMDEIETMTISSEVDTAEFDEKAEIANLELYRQERENELFPDEVDTPLDAPARVRFQKYRGLKSFRTSPWDVKENLPYDYARIFQFENFKRTAKRVINEEKNGAMHGWFVCIHIANVPTSFVESIESQEYHIPLVIYGLLPHEQKISLLNFVVRKHPSCRVTVKAKEKLIFHVGYRRFSAGAIFSQHTNGDKHKFERFLPNNDPTVMSVFGPIIFPPSSVLVFREDSKGRHQLVASGAVLDINPNRVVVKRLVLSGHPFKINKRSAVVRYMFFNRDDILWFKPVELRTKYGRHGHIKEAVGTHGHMKCTFDGPVTSQDTAFLYLYKRVYPKWTYDPNVKMPSLGFRNLSSLLSSADALMNDE